MSDEPFKGEINKYDILFLCDIWLLRENIDICLTLFLEIKGETNRLSIWGGFQLTSAMNSTKQYLYLMNQMKTYSGPKLGKI